MSPAPAIIRPLMGVRQTRVRARHFGPHAVGERVRV